jgi:hypothetical protein
MEFLSYECAGGNCDYAGLIRWTNFNCEGLKSNDAVVLDQVNHGHIEGSEAR